VSFSNPKNRQGRFAQIPSLQERTVGMIIVDIGVARLKLDVHVRNPAHQSVEAISLAPKAAITAAARKLLTILNAMMRDKKEWGLT
jgi:hypothetical protein